MTPSTSSRLVAINCDRDIDRLTGREWLFNEIDHWLQHKDGRFFSLTGEPGVGKSAIASHLIQNRKDIVAYHLCQAADLETLKPGRILRLPSKPKQLQAP